MISRDFSIPQFVVAMRGRPFFEVRRRLEEEKRESEQSAPRGRSRQAEANQHYRYAADLRGLSWLLDTGGKPSGVDDYTFQQFRPLIEDQVRMGVLRPTALTVFEQHPQVRR
jgi:hypothetical protein